MHRFLFALLFLLSLPAFGKPTAGKMHTRSLKRGGFEIVSNKDGEEVLLGYSSHGNLEKAKLNPGFQLLMKAFENSDIPFSRPLMLASHDFPDAVEPLLTDTWDQGEPYNLYTPCIDNQHCLVGCVALAMGQVLRYWKAQPHAEEYTYTDSLGCEQTLTAHFPSSYDYSNMLDSYEDGSYTEEQLAAVARLLADCGVAVEMRYGIQSSGANTIHQAMALRNIFAFSPSIQHFYRNFYTTSEWYEMLRTELSEGRPVLMAAQSPSLAHAFVCDGYDEQGFFHLNLGMDGDADGYYYLPYLTPKQPEWYDLDSPEGGMNLLQYAIFGATPFFASTEVPRYAFVLGEMEALKNSASRDGEISLVSRNLSNVGWNKHEGELALLLKKGDEVLDVLARYNHDFLLSELVDTSYTDTFSFSIPTGVSDGIYRIVPAFQQPVSNVSEDGYSFVWEEARTCVGTPNYLLLEVTSKGVTLSADSIHTATLSLADFAFPDTIASLSQPDFSFTFKNGSMPYCGCFYVVLEPVDKEGKYHYIQYQGLDLAPEETTYRHFHRTTVPLAVGDYNLRLFYEQNLFSDSLLSLSEEPLKVVHIVGTNGISATRDIPSASSYIDLQGRPLPQPRKQEIYIEQRKERTRKVLKR